MNLIWIFFQDPLGLPLDYSYNLNVLSEVTVTDSFLSLHENVRSCQEKEYIVDFITKKYMTNLKESCKCLPLKLGLHAEVKENK